MTWLSANARPLSALGLGAAILVSCASPPSPPVPQLPPPPPMRPPPPAAPTPPSSAVPAPSRAGAFFLMRDSQTAKLAYGPAQSDSVLLLLRCRRGEGRIQITDSAPTGAATLTLTSGQARSPLPARIQADEEHHGVLVLAEAPIDLPALASFRANGRITLEVGRHVVNLAAKPAEMKRVSGFFAICEGRKP